MIERTVNIITTILGFMVIIASVVSVFLKDIAWADVLWGGVMGIALIYVKNNRMTRLIEGIVSKKTQSDE